jgi:hypothetical protein
VAAHTPSRKSVNGQIGYIASKNPSDPRLPYLRAYSDALHVAEIAAWAREAAKLLPALSHEEVAKVAREMAAIETRLRRRASAA